MKTYRAQQGIFAGRPPCAVCGAAYRLHRVEADDDHTYLKCPDAYRPDNLDTARRELADAEQSGDPARVFVARGNLQHLGRQK